MNLFDGLCELRIAFDNFTWVTPDGESIPIAFPAVRGQICEGTDPDDSDSCTTWDPCEHARNCTCEWNDGSYYCQKPQEYNDYSIEMEELNLEWLAELFEMVINYTSTSTQRVETRR